MLRVAGWIGRLERVWLAALLSVIALALAAADVLQRADNMLYDLDVRLLPSSPSQNITVVAIDEESLSAFGHWPWPRRLHAQLIDRMTQAGAKVIGMDILFAEPDPSDPAGDALLAQAIRSHGRVVLPVAPAIQHGARLGVARPIAPLADVATIGHADVELDADGIVRSVYLHAGINRPQWPALALAMLDLGEPQRAAKLATERPATAVADVANRWVRDHRHLIRFVGPAGTMPHVSFARVVQNDPEALEALRGRYVLVGVTAAGLGQALVTPVSGMAKPMPGVELNANVLASLSRGVAVAPVPHGISIVLTALLALVPVLVYPRIPAGAALAGFGAMLLLPLAASFGLLHLAQLWFGPAAALAAIAVSYPLWSWRRLDAAMSALSAERNVARATLHCIGDAVITVDRAGRVIYLNPVAQALTGRTAAEARGRPLQEILVAYDETGERHVSMPLHECLVEGRVVQTTRYCLLYDDQGEHAIRWSAAPIREGSGVISGMVLAFSDVTETLSLSREMLRQATHDALTGLPNRALVEDRLESAIARARRAGGQVAVMFIDLDGFKKVNDALGHGAGDALLIEIAARLKSCCREEDTVARWGGDEFVVVLEKVQTQDSVVARVRTMLELLSSPVRVLEQEVYVTGSIGISLFPRDDDDVGGLFKRADAALYRAKDQGRNAFQFYSEEMSERALERVALEKSLWGALRNSELTLYYQPEFDRRGGHIVGFEALLRWQRGAGDLVLPGRFLKVAEQSDLIHVMGDWVLQRACAQLAQFRDWGLPELTLAVNLAPRQLHNRELYPRVEELTRQHGIECSSLMLEISEELFLHDFSGVEQSLRELRDIGVRVAIDDFGTGYASIGYLKRLPIDQVKIDKSFVRDVPHNADDSAIVSGIITLAHSLRLEVIAEGVENQAQVRFLEAQACDGMQGFYLSRPLPASALKEYLYGWTGRGSTQQPTHGGA
jgi:diguanylate cyclase (GGDEF)-like protein/PAS domain S-box-containing protein